MFTRNEKGKLESRLPLASDIADETVIAYTGSTDRTKAIARKYTKKVPDFEWADDFSQARSLSSAGPA